MHSHIVPILRAYLSSYIDVLETLLTVEDISAIPCMIVFLVAIGYTHIIVLV